MGAALGVPLGGADVTDALAVAWDVGLGVLDARGVPGVPGVLIPPWGTGVDVDVPAGAVRAGAGVRGVGVPPGATGVWGVPEG